MKKVVVILLGIYTFSLAAVNLNSCKSCHGKDWEKAALGASRIVKDMTQDEVTKALLGYKNGTYGSNMKGVMHTNVKMYSEDELKHTGIGLDQPTIKHDFNPNIDIQSCKGCHGQDWEKAALGASKIVRNMTKAEVTKALLGYKYGTYGRNMKGVMHTNVKMYSDEDLKNSGIGIQKKQKSKKITASFDLSECKACHGKNFEKASLGSSKIVSDMTQKEITDALLGYKKGTYGASMKGVMVEKLKNFSIEQLKSIKIGE
jgi:cytochrome c